MKKVNLSMIFGLISVCLLSIGLILPAIDFSVFHDQIQIEYNLMKICKNIGLISSMWVGIPYGIIIGIVIMAILSFVKIPVFKLIPSMLVLIMLILMVVDIGNVIDWVNGIIEKYANNGMETVDIQDIFRAFRSGIYCMIAGIIFGITSCFFKVDSKNYGI